jgi:hypothetical protein
MLTERDYSRTSLLRFLAGPSVHASLDGCAVTATGRVLTLLTFNTAREPLKLLTF